MGKTGDREQRHIISTALILRLFVSTSGYYYSVG